MEAPDPQDDISKTGTEWIPLDTKITDWVEEKQRESMQWTTWTTPEGHTVRCDRNIHAQQFLAEQQILTKK